MGSEDNGGATSGAAAGFADGWAELGDVRLHYVEQGTGPLVLFLHGFPQFWWLWRAQIAEFGRDHRAVAPDMRGYNLSSAPPEVEAYRMRNLLGDVRGLVEHLGVERFTLVGHDWGGIVSWAFAVKYPELLERLVICDAPPPFTWGRELERTPRQREAVRYMEDFSKPSPLGEDLIRGNDFAAMEALAIGRGIEKGYLDESARALYRAAWSQPGAVTGGLNYYRAARMGDQVSAGQPAEAQEAMRSMRVEVPTLVIWGSRRQFLAPWPDRRNRGVGAQCARGDPRRCRPLGAAGTGGGREPPDPRVHRLTPAAASRSARSRRVRSCFCIMKRSPHGRTARRIAEKIPEPRRLTILTRRRVRFAPAPRTT